MAYISDCLTHWIGRARKSDDERYDLFTKEILAKSRLLFSACKWNFSSRYGGVSNFSIPMISFTDIPFSEAGPHCARYSKFGISFNTAYLANCLATPVGYVVSPFAHTAFSTLFHRLDGMRKLVDGKTVPDGGHRGQVFDTQEMLVHLMAICYNLETYDAKDPNIMYGDPAPTKEQEAYFNNPASLYYEREWRIVERMGSALPWDHYEGGRHFFHFDPKYIKHIVMPRLYLDRFLAEKDAYLQGADVLPSLLAFEDLA